MLEFPLLTEWFRERDVQTGQRYVLVGLEARFGQVPEDVSAAVRAIADEARLRELHRLLFTCESAAAFRSAVGL